MNTPEGTKVEFEALPEWYEPFHEPQTYPAGWDLSAVIPAVTPERLDEPTAHAED